jgi:hypothetical protein
MSDSKSPAGEIMTEKIHPVHANMFAKGGPLLYCSDGAVVKLGVFESILLLVNRVTPEELNDRYAKPTGFDLRTDGPSSTAYRGKISNAKLSGASGGLFKKTAHSSLTKLTRDRKKA